MKLKDPGNERVTKVAMCDSFARDLEKYVECWANLMEERMTRGEKIENIFESTGREAEALAWKGEFHPYTFQCAAVLMRDSWLYGPEFRAAYNKKLAEVRGEEAPHGATCQVGAR